MNGFMIHIAGPTTVFIGVLALLMPLLLSSKRQIHIPNRFDSVGTNVVKLETIPLPQTTS